MPPTRPLRIAFRADASVEIGSGHVMRCLTLAEALKVAGAACHFICSDLPGHMMDRIVSHGHSVTALPAQPADNAARAGLPLEEEIERSRKILAALAPDRVVVDHYALDARWETAAVPPGTPIMVIDDLADRPHAADLLLDQNLGRTAEDYDRLVPDGCTRLIGPAYALLRPDFAETRSETLALRADRGLEHLLISFGGADPVDATSKVLEALRNAPVLSDMKLEVVMGAQSPALEKVRALARDMQMPTEVVVDVSDMATRMAMADLAIGAGGATTWERCSLGLPSIVVGIAANQSSIARAVAEAGVALDPGPLLAPEFARRLQEVVVQALEPACLTTLSENAAELCDGDGVGRVMAALFQQDTKFRGATLADSRRIWEWRRDVASARFNLSGDRTGFVEHHEWYRAALLDPCRAFRIMQLGDLPCGYIRLDMNEGGAAWISICLSKEMRGRGLAAALLSEARRFAVELKLARLDAKVHVENIASQRCFEEAGYRLGPYSEPFRTYHLYLETVA